MPPEPHRPRSRGLADARRRGSYPTAIPEHDLRAHRLLLGLVGLVTGWLLWLLWRNGFTAEHALGLLVVVAIVSAVFRSARIVAAYGAFALAGVAIVAAVVPAPRVSPLLFASYLVVVLVVFVAAVRNRQRTERDLAISEARYALAAHGAHDGLWDWDVAAQSVYLSQRWKEIVGCADREIGPSPNEWLDRIHPEDRARTVWRLLESGEPAGSLFELEYRIKHRDGGWRWVLTRGVRVVDAGGDIVRMAGSQTDITERKRVEEQLVHDALHDALTGLPNRALFLDRVSNAIAHTTRHPDAPFAVIFLDVDRFKVVNDRLGHVTADRLLAAMATRLHDALPDGDTIARLGGDEFAVLLRDVADPAPIAERLQHALQWPFDVDSQQVVVTASLGIAISSTGFTRPEDVLRDADAAMYRAKARGRARYEIADAELHADSHRQLALEAQLRDAVERDELRLHYQPIVLMESGTLVGFEALLRWQHPERGLRPPDEFIGLAEQTGLIVSVGRWALREACRQMDVWRASLGAGHVWVSVNLSSRQLLYPQLVRETHEILAETGFPADRLRLEITESVIMDDPATVSDVLRALRATGIRVAIDDFGTGYSSLAYLHRLPIDTLKIDRSFVSQMRADTSVEAVVRAVVSLADSLGLDTVAEGVETVEEVGALRRMGCELGQGFLFARPLAPKDATELLASAAVA